MTNTTVIRVTYSSIDGCRKTRTFKTLAGAQRFAQEYVGRYPEMGSSYAVSGDGVGQVTCRGVALAELFPPLAPAAPSAPIAYDADLEEYDRIDARACDAYYAAQRDTAARYYAGLDDCPF